MIFGISYLIPLLKFWEHGRMTCRQEVRLQEKPLFAEKWRTHVLLQLRVQIIQRGLCGDHVWCQVRVGALQLTWAPLWVQPTVVVEATELTLSFLFGTLVFHQSGCVTHVLSVNMPSMYIRRRTSKKGTLITIRSRNVRVKESWTHTHTRVVDRL